MCKVFKGVFFVICIFVLLICSKVEASSAYFVWEKTEIIVPLNSSLEEYKDDYVLSFYVDGIKSDDFTVESEVNCSTFSTVLTNKIGKYTVYYKAISEKYYVSSTQAIIFCVVDVNPPSIIMDSNIIKIECGNEIDIQKNFIISDDTTEFVELIILVDDSYVLYNMVGTYDAYITVIDKYNNMTKKDFKVEVVDNIAPQILVQKPLQLSYGVELDVKEYFIATDNSDGNITSLIKIEGLDIYKIGTQEITVSVSDYSNNKTTIKLTVNVLDNEKPNLLLECSEVTLDIVEFDEYNAQFFKKYIIDIYDNSTNKEELHINIDCSNLKEEVSDYEIYYSISDKNGNIDTEVLVVKLRELNGPLISGEEEISINLYEEIDLYSLVSVSDLYDLNAKDRLEILESNFSNQKTGRYNVTYICYNNSGKYSTKTVVINVIDDSLETGSDIEKKEFELTEELILKISLGIVILTLIVLVIKKRK